MRLFGPSREEVWTELCRQIGAEYVNGGFWKGDMLKAQVGPWTVVLDTYTQQSGGTPGGFTPGVGGAPGVFMPGQPATSHSYTRLRAPYLYRDSFQFALYRRNILTDIGKLFGMQDIRTGDHQFDEVFVVKANNEDRAPELLSDDRLRHMLLQAPHIDFRVVDDEGFFGPSFPENVDELRLVCGEVRDVERLRLFFDLFAETLHQLCVIGSAEEASPGHPLG
jgi:hypothetical protein